MKSHVTEKKMTFACLSILIIIVALTVFVRILPEAVQETLADIIFQYQAFLYTSLVLLLSLLITGLIKLYRHPEQMPYADYQSQAKYHHSHTQALALYNGQASSEEMLQGTLHILATNHAFSASLFYRHDRAAGTLHLAATYGKPGNVKQLVHVGEGPIGEAGQRLSMIRMTADTGRNRKCLVEAGLSDLNADALVFCPVICRHRLYGVLVLAVSGKLAQQDTDFIELFSMQLGLALHNAEQLRTAKLLAEQLCARNEEMTHKSKAIEEASRMKSEFLANMSHELRTPLNSIIGFSEVMLDGIGGTLTADQKDYTSNVLLSGQHLLALINDILDLSKIESGHMTLVLEPVDPALLVSSAIAMLKEKAAGHRIVLQQEVEPELGRMCLDIRKARQIVYNLLFNAVKFTPAGGEVLIRMRRSSHADVTGVRAVPGVRLFSVTENHHSHYLEVSVSDTGIGIRHDDLERLFQPFTQIDSSHSRQHDGTGLGLALVRKLAELHGGGVMAQSVPDQGSCFTVWLPWRDDEAAGAMAVMEK
jgi:signal transduction histidine kinase